MGCYPKTAREFLRRLTIRENWLRFAKSTPYTQTLTDNSAPSWANSRGLFYETNPIFRGPTLTVALERESNPDQRSPALASRRAAGP